KNIPKTKNKFHASFFQSYLKNEILAGTHDAQICRSDELIPKLLFPKINNAGTVKPINGPAMYHGQGCFKNSIIFCYSLNSIVIKISYKSFLQNTFTANKVRMCCFGVQLLLLHNVKI